MVFFLVIHSKCFHCKMRAWQKRTAGGQSDWLLVVWSPRWMMICVAAACYMKCEKKRLHKTIKIYAKTREYFLNRVQNLIKIPIIFTVFKLIRILGIHRRRNWIISIYIKKIHFLRWDFWIPSCLQVIFLVGWCAHYTVLIFVLFSDFFLSI